MTTLYQRSWPQMNETPDSLLATDEPLPFTIGKAELSNPPRKMVGDVNPRPERVDACAGKTSA